MAPSKRINQINCMDRDNLWPKAIKFTTASIAIPVKTSGIKRQANTAIGVASIAVANTAINAWFFGTTMRVVNTIAITTDMI